MTLDKETRLAIANAVDKCIYAAEQRYKEAKASYEEVWLSEDELLKQFQMLSPNWVKRYGKLLPRTQFEVTIITRDGREVKKTRWAYARNKIQEWIQNGTHRTLTIYE